MNGDDHVTTCQSSIGIHPRVAADADDDAHGRGAVKDDGRVAERGGRGEIVHEYDGRRWETHGEGGTRESGGEVIGFGRGRRTDDGLAVGG